MAIESRDPKTQYDGDKRTVMGRLVPPELLDPSLEDCLGAFRRLRASWSKALVDLNAEDAELSAALTDPWAPIEVMNHTGGTLEQAALMVRGALRGIHQSIEDLDGQWLGENLSFERVRVGCEAAFDEFESALSAAIEFEGKSATISSPYLNRGEVRHWARNMALHLAEHVAQMRKVRGVAAGEWEDGMRLHAAAFGSNADS